jgi:hypothetical protein
MSGPLVMLDLDHSDPQVLHVAKPYTERNHDLHSPTCVSDPALETVSPVRGLHPQI